MALTITEAQVVLDLAKQLSGHGSTSGEDVDRLAGRTQWLTRRAHDVLSAGNVPAVGDLATGLLAATVGATA